MKQTNLLPPTPGLPYTREDIILEQVRREEHLYTVNVPNPLPPPVPQPPILRRSLTVANWVKANIIREVYCFTHV